jgi:succinate dehydrogenase / fumarate reductase cytochrome b subunit
MAANHRPLSPHLQVYRPQITSVLSILHRITGVVMSVGLVALTYWLVALAGGEAAYATALTVLGSVPGKLFLFGWSLAFFYHLSNGVRHLFWDTGRGFEIPQVYRSGWTAVGIATLLTIIFWTAVLSGGQ